MIWMSAAEFQLEKEFMEALNNCMIWGSPRERWLCEALDKLAFLEGDNEKLRLLLSHELATITAHRQGPLHINDCTHSLQITYANE